MTHVFNQIIMAAGPLRAALELAGVSGPLRIVLDEDDAARLAAAIGVQAKPSALDDGLQEMSVGPLTFVTKAAP